MPKVIHVTHPAFSQVVFGRKRPSPFTPKLHLKNYLLHANLAAPPASVSYASKASASLSQMYLNDQLGDCVIAGGYHVVGTTTGNATGTPFIATQNQIIADYSAIGGYVPGDPNTDNGCDEQTALNYWKSHGFADGTKIAGWLAVDATNVTEVMQAMYLFENLFFGLELPDAWVNPFPSSSGFTWNDGTPDPNNGHCVVGVGYNAQGVQIDTWGMIGTMTWAAVSHLCSAAGGGELYVMLTPDMIAKGQTVAPNGLNWYQLATDFNTMGGSVPVPVPPAPSPSPSPSPSPQPVPTPPPVPPQPVPSVVTLNEAIAWATKGLTQNWPAHQACPYCHKIIK